MNEQIFLYSTVYWYFVLSSTTYCSGGELQHCWKEKHSNKLKMCFILIMLINIPEREDAITFIM